MASKLDYTDGVFVFTCSSPKRAYVGKSTGVGAAKRSTKSKLKKDKFHNKEMQKDYNEFPDNFDLVGEVFILEGNKWGCNTLAELADEVRWEYIDKDYLLWNDIHVVEGKEKQIEVDVLRDIVDGDDYNVVMSIANMLSSGEIESKRVREMFLGKGIEL
jgi:hypothetical protein